MIRVVYETDERPDPKDLAESWESSIRDQEYEGVVGVTAIAKVMGIRGVIDAARSVIELEKRFHEQVKNESNGND